MTHYDEEWNNAKCSHCQKYYHSNGDDLHQWNEAMCDGCARKNEDRKNEEYDQMMGWSDYDDERY